VKRRQEQIAVGRRLAPAASGAPVAIHIALGAAPTGMRWTENGVDRGAFLGARLCADDLEIH
jgi:hypothetical protein